MALALCLTLLPTAALAAEPEGTAQTPPAVEESTDPANGEAKQENQPAAPEQEGQSAEAKQESQSAEAKQEGQPAEAKQEKQSVAPEQENQSAEQEEQQEDSAAKQAVAAVQAMIDALPDAEALDGMDDADAMAVYEAFQTACDAYYETLTEGQQAQLKNTEKLEALSAWFSQSAALAAGGHQHPICGASCTDDENHNNVTWTGAMGVTGLRAGGHYYLMKDVEVSETWHPEDGVVLCLNGHSITATTTSINVIEVDKGKTFTLTDCGTAGMVTHEAEKRGRGVMVFGTFNLYGGNITGNQTDGNYNDRGTFGAGVYVATYSVFNMYGGKITGNMGYSGGGSVYVAPTYADSSRAVFNMSGGEISGNSSLYGNSSGVYVNGGEFIMSGGSITGNAGYGVDLCDYKNNVGATYPGAFTVSGKVSVTGNYKNVYNNGTLVGTLDYNVFLSTGKTITVEGTLDAASKIGITTQGEASADIATGGVGEDYESIFSSDVKDKGYSFTKKDDGTLHFNGHDHNWQFAATTDMIWAKCATPGCPVTTIDSIDTEHCNGGFVWLKVQDTTYGSNSKNAWVDPSKQTTWRGPAVSTIEIYYRNSETGEDLGTTAPTLPGSYTASITVEGQTVTRGFKITKATPTINWNGYPYSTGFTGTFTGNAIADPTGVTVLVNGSSSANLLAQTTFTWYKATVNGSSYSKASDTPLPESKPTDAGDYLVEAVIPPSDTTSKATYTKGVTIQKAQNLGGSDVTVPVAVKMYPSADAKTYPVDLLEVLTDYRHGGSLALNSTGIIFYDTDLLTSAILNGNTVEITMKPTANVPANRTVTVSVFLTSRNYETIPVVITLTMQPKPTVNDIAVTMDSWTYGGTASKLQVNGLPTGVELTDPAVTVTYTNTKDGTTSSKRPTDAGSYTVTVSYETDTVIHTGTKDFTISKREIAVPTADSRQFEYTGQEQTYVLGNFADAAYYTVSGAMTRTAAGSQNVTVQLKDKNNTVWKGGTDADKTYVFTIAPKPLSKVTIGDFPDKTYTGLSIRPVVVPVDDNTALTEDTDYTVSYGANTNVGKATITVTGIGNYTGTVSKEWNITPAVLTISGVTVADKTYNGSADATVTAVAFNGLKNDEKLEIGTDYEVIGAAFNGENVDTADKVTGTVALKGTEKAKNYTLSSAAFEQAAAIGRADYNGTASKTVNIVKGRSAVQTGTLTAADFFPEGQMPDGAKITAWSLTSPTTAILSAVSVGGGKLSYLSAENIATASEESGSVTIATTNYKDITATLTFHPTDKLVQDGFKFENGSVTKTYGDEDFTLTTTGKVEGSTVTYESSEPAVAEVDSATGKVTIKGAGTAVITAKASATEDYDEAAVTCTLTVEKKPIAIPTADATVFTYNGTEQTYALAEDGAYTITGNKQTNANETGYSVTAALKDTANTQWADGTTANKTYTFVIGKAVITVKAKDQTAYVGDKAPTLGEDSYTVSGLVGEEKLTTQPTVKYVGADGSEITPDMTKTGEVKILAGGAAASDNYTIRYEDGKLTISTRPSGGGGGSRPSTNPVQTEVSKDPDGTVSLSKTSAAKGDKVTITVKPERHYEVGEVIVRDSKGKQLTVKDNGDGTYTFEMPADKVTVEPTFTWVNPFADVANSAYYVDAVEWMLKREVTQGTTETTFSPNLNCTRAQIVTFLWRAAGSPEPKGTVGFADVSAGSYYAKAVAWAVENGITGGTGNGLFSPDAACTRAQSAAFLYRAAGSPAVNGSAGFSDVAADAYYAQAVAWAKEHGITDGIGGGLFGSANDCTRAQIAAFLWRLYAEK